MSPDMLAYLANQIGCVLAHQPHDKAVAAIEAHPNVREAVERLTEKQAS